MITKEMLDRINYLAKKSKSQDGLNEEEKLEQKELRKKYVKHITGQVKQQLDSIKYVDEDGNEVKKHVHGKNCGCKNN